MHARQVTAIAVALLATQCTCLNLLPPRDVSPAVVSLKIKRSGARHIDALRRRDTVTVDLDNEINSYTANLSLGTPPQDMRVRIDTGSSDLWVNTDSSRICSLRVDPCAEAGTYNANDSSSYRFVSDDFNVSYVDGTAALGDYVTDTMNIGGQSLEDFQFGIGYRSGTAAGILGLGYTLNEAQVNRNNRRPYPNLPQALADAGFIQSNAYSLWLDDLESSTGEILFGGVDTDKYTGSLQTLPVQEVQGQYAELLISISGVSISQGSNNQSITSALPTVSILDSGSTITYLPDQLTNDIYSALDVQFSERQQTGFCRCDLADEDVNIDFTFTSPTISVPIREMVINPNDDLSQDSLGLEKRQGFSDEDSFCLFGIAPSGGQVAVLGDTFLRSAYVVYDLENNEISLAQTNFDSNATNIREIGTGSDSVPDASAVSNPIQATPSRTGGARVGNPTSTSSSGDDSESGGNGNYSLVSLPLLLAGILGGAAFFLCM